MRWKSHVRFGAQARETHPPKGGQSAPVRSHLAKTVLDKIRRRVQQQTLGHRGHNHDPLYWARKLLVSASENITDSGRVRLWGLLDVGDPYGEVRDARCR